ncbi:hypothetical protein NQ314_009837 [Rhamnusium bicolor]|uniref:DDE-1 domain-containing protein n=1 Tax=Rhamnusium bicolor TaxID=1586634 RepID=A0AAV8XX74_9CUCU|nr:hypothetical protein NQ314_009837 [Rhamnusium bicolor]
MWVQWTEGVLKGYPCCSDSAAGASYNRTCHGWFDAQTFTDWFVTIFLPHAKRLVGRKVLIGDNLSSHFTDEVIRCDYYYVMNRTQVSYACRKLR